MTMPSDQPVSRYFSAAAAPRDFELKGPARVVTCGGRSGWNATSVHTRFVVPVNPTNDPAGSLTLWVLPLEDWVTTADTPGTAKLEPNHGLYTLLADLSDFRRAADVSFHFFWQNAWYPSLVAKFFRGHLWQAWHEPHLRALAWAEHFGAARLEWVQFTLTWNHEAHRYAIFANGVRVATGDLFLKPQFEPGDSLALYAGNPSLALSDLAFYDRELSDAEVAACYEREKTSDQSRLLEKLRHQHAAEGLKTLAFAEDETWSERLRLPLNRPEDLQAFYVQGMTSAPSITPEGLEVKTSPLKNPGEGIIDDRQVYLWTWQTFEGDLHVSYEFKPLKEVGLSLLMTQASGMQREDFMKDHPLRVDGSMKTVCWENVRNYHWEYYRTIYSSRQDLATNVLVKNPYFMPLAYQTIPRLAVNEWHRLEFIQTGERIRGLIDGLVVFDHEDRCTPLSGPLYQAGHIAIRCMWTTHMLFRNLRVATRSPGFTTSSIDS